MKGGYVKYAEEEKPIQSIVFGLGHRARHGKDTVASIIKANRGIPDALGHYDIRIYSLGAELKAEVNENAIRAGGMINLFAQKNGGPHEYLEYMQMNGNFITLPDWVQFDPNPPMDDPLCPLGKQRTLLQWWGTEFRRSIDPDYWVKKLATRIAKDQPEIAIVTDVRFPNEVNWVRQYGEVIKVMNNRVPILPHGHPSEESLAYMKDADWDAVIYNDGTLEDLKQMALFVFDELMNEKHPRPAAGFIGSVTKAIVRGEE